MSPQESNTYRQINGVAFHIGNKVFVKTSFFMDKYYLEIRPYNKPGGKPDYRKGLNVPYEYLGNLKHAVDAAVVDFEAGKKLF